MEKTYLYRVRHEHKNTSINLFELFDNDELFEFETKMNEDNWERFFEYNLLENLILIFEIIPSK